MYTHEGILQRLQEKVRVKLRVNGRLWVDQKGRKFSRETGKRPLDSTAGIRLLLDTIKETA
jgi:hypothetical protein